MCQSAGSGSSAGEKVLSFDFGSRTQAESLLVTVAVEPSITPKFWKLELSEASSLPKIFFCISSSAFLNSVMPPLRTPNQPSNSPVPVTFFSLDVSVVTLFVSVVVLVSPFVLLVSVLVVSVLVASLLVEPSVPAVLSLLLVSAAVSCDSRSLTAAGWTGFSIWKKAKTYVPSAKYFSS